MFCRNCGSQLNENAAVCLNCGVKAGVGKNYCPYCGSQPDPMAVICVKCGRELKPQSIKSGGVDSFGDAISACFKKFASFEGRANRSEFWYFYLFYVLCSFLAWIPILGQLLMLAFIVPYISVAVRRLHDIGKSGWWYWISLIPIVGAIWLIVLYCQPSQEGDNEYGPNPNF